MTQPLEILPSRAASIVEAGQALLVDDDFQLDDRITIQPTPGYTRPYLCPDELMECTRGSRKSHSSSGSMNGATKPPEAPSTWTGMSQPFSCCTVSRASQISLTGS